MKKIFIVEASFGDWDIARTEVIKCFESEKEAKDYCEKFNRVITKVSDFCKESWDVVSEKSYDDEEDYKKCFDYSIWVKYNNKFSYFNNTNIIERDYVPHRRKRNIKKLIG